jgi:hypothetical protein
MHVAGGKGKEDSRLSTRLIITGIAAVFVLLALRALLVIK